MPTIHVDIPIFDKYIGEKLSFEQLEKLSFEFGIEIELKEKEADEKQDNKKQKKQFIYAFEIAANRPDLLSVEGLCIALGCYRKTRSIPEYKIAKINQKDMYSITINESCNQIRPHVVSAILRNLNFDKIAYNSFIDFQDKLHMNICRRRKLASVGTHDLDKIQGKKLVYLAQKPQDIKFVPLKIGEGQAAKEMNSQEILDMYKQHIQLKEYVPLIYDSPVHPVIRDESGSVLSLPPIINSDYSKISENTRNIFIEVTALDLNRAEIVLNQIIANFSIYCNFEIEPVKVIQVNKQEIVYPILKHTYFETSLAKVNNMGNFVITKEQCHQYLKQMMLIPVETNKDKIGVNVPITRSDILQECDILEDICIAYGYNNIKLELPSSFTFGSQLYLNKMTNLVRQQLAQAGYSENLNFILCHPKDLTENLNNYKGFSQGEYVELANPKYAEYSVVRSTLIPGLMKWLSNNKASKIPMKLFEIGDICIKDASTDTGAKNIRHLAALYTNQESDFELIHGLLDFIMQRMGFQLGNGKNNTYKLEASDGIFKFIQAKLFFEGIGANVIFNDQVIGVTGVLDPQVGEKFEWKYPVSLLELNLQVLVEHFN